MPALDTERQEVYDICEKQNYWEAKHEATLDKDVIFNKFNIYKGRLAVFHYSGHASDDFLKLQDVALQDQTLVILIKAELEINAESLALVFLNGCATKEIAKKLTEYGVKCVIATNRSILDSEAKEFAIQFYTTWISGNSIKSAFDKAQAYILNDKNKQDWSKRGVRLDDHTHPESWCLEEKETGIASTITLKSIQENYQKRTPHIFFQNADIQYLSTLSLKPKTAYQPKWIYKQEAKEILETSIFIDDLQTKASQKQYLQIVVVAGKEHEYLPKAWQPFGQENILDLLIEFGRESKLGLHIVFLQTWNIKEQRHKNKLKGGKHTIFIIDKNAIENLANQELIKCIDETQGGLLAPHSAGTNWENVLPTAYTKWRKTFDEPFMFIDLEVPDKEILFRRLQDLEALHITPSKNIQSKINVND